jgi:N-acetylmuramoyl-L-alanine amidase
MINLKIYCFKWRQKQDKSITFAQKYTTNAMSFRGVFMKLIKNYFIVFLCAILLVLSFVPTLVLAQDARFTVVLDAGHGGHDPGAMGAFSREKDINLAIELHLGALIEQNFKDVKVVYTRKTDKYLTLQERADVVNDHHADLFICVHTNSSPSPAAFGTETFTLGLAKTKANLDVAMRENSVILLEEDYRSKYKGFDPKSVDSYIMFEFMQDKYIDKSVEFSSAVQKQFVSYCGRTDHGVRQAGFWVLHRSACPSVLVEVGFISNPAEERFLMSEQGQKQMATAIYNAFVDYKKSHDKRSGHPISKVSKVEPPVSVTEARVSKQIKQAEEDHKPLETEVVRKQKIVDVPKLSDTSRTRQVLTPVTLQREDRANTKPIFKVQIFAARVELQKNAPDFKGLDNVEFFIENKHYKYTLGAETSYFKIQQIRKSILSKFPDAFIIAFDGDRKLSPKEVLELSR